MMDNVLCRAAGWRPKRWLLVRSEVGHACRVDEYYGERQLVESGWRALGSARDVMDAESGSRTVGVKLLTPGSGLGATVVSRRFHLSEN